MARNHRNQPNAETGPRTDRIKVPDADYAPAPPAPLAWDRAVAPSRLTLQDQQTAFIDRAAAIRVRVLDHLEENLDRYLKFLIAQGIYTEDECGRRTFELPDDVQMTPDQAAAWKVILNRLMPNFAPVRMDGREAGGRDDGNPLRNGTVHVTINQSGGTPDYGSLPGSVDGVQIQHAQAQQTSRIEFRGDEQVIVHPDGTVEPLT